METGEVVRGWSTQAVGWRVWTVQERPEGVRLGGVIHEAVWTPGLVGRATCSLGLPHIAPIPVAIAASTGRVTRSTPSLISTDGTRAGRSVASWVK